MPVTANRKLPFCPEPELNKIISLFLNSRQIAAPQPSLTDSFNIEIDSETTKHVFIPDDDEVTEEDVEEGNVRKVACPRGAAADICSIHNTVSVRMARN